MREHVVACARHAHDACRTPGSGKFHRRCVIAITTLVVRHDRAACLTRSGAPRNPVVALGNRALGNGGRALRPLAGTGARRWPPSGPHGIRAHQAAVKIRDEPVWFGQNAAFERMNEDHLFRDYETGDLSHALARKSLHRRARPESATYRLRMKQPPQNENPLMLGDHR